MRAFLLTHTHAPVKQQSGSDIRRQFLIHLAIAVLSVLCFSQVKDHQFLEFDDNIYITENPRIRNGVSLENLEWAFTAVYSANWHPITWLSHMLDVELFGMNPGAHHLVNLFLHTLNSIMVFLLLHKMTGERWKSGWVSVLFAVHPLCVESVAWIAQRKNLLCLFFFLLTVSQYASYVERKSGYGYLLMLLFFSLALMAKPMPVTLPFVLLLFDYWPLDRLQTPKAGTQEEDPRNKFPTLGLVKEKIPIFFLSFVSSFLAYASQSSDGAVKSLELCPFHIRVANALLSYATYLRKMLWPQDLCAFYPHSGYRISSLEVLISGLVIACVSLLVIRFSGKLRFLPVGWFFYLGTLVPVIGLVQIGSQAMADRYTYLPQIGIYILFAWGIGSLVRKMDPWGRGLISIASCMVLFGLIISTRNQVGHWRDDRALFVHMLQVSSNNHIAHNGLGLVLFREGRTGSAIKHFKESIAINPAYSSPYNNLGTILFEEGDMEAAITHFQKAVSYNPKNAKAHNNLAAAVATMGDVSKAIESWQTAVRIHQDYLNAHLNLAKAYMSLGRHELAREHIMNVLRLDPVHPAARDLLEQTDENPSNLKRLPESEGMIQGDDRT